MASLEKLKSKCDWKKTWFTDTKWWPLVSSYCSQMSYTKVKGYQRSSCKINSNCKIHLIWKVEVHLEPNLGYWYNVGIWTCLWSQRSQMKVKGHLRSICKMVWNVKFDLFEPLRTNSNYVTQTGVGLRSGVNMYHPQTVMAGDSSSPGTWKNCFSWYNKWS